MEVVGELVRPPEPGGFPGWLLVRDTEEGRRAQAEYADYWYRNKYHGGPDSPHRAVVGVQEVAADAKGRPVLRLKYVRPFKGDPPGRGERFLLSERFTDFTTDALVRFLEGLDLTGGGLLLDLLRTPEEAAAPLPLPKRVETAAARAADQFGFTPSQRAAYDAIRGQRVTAVWGPPGTGKTHFLASTILGLAAAHAATGKPFRVLVTAYTHAAIENLLRKLAQLREARGGPAGLRLAKAKYWQTAPHPIEVVAEADLGNWLDDSDLSVLGATAYSCLKDEGAGEFDLVVIDEASQVRVPEVAVAVSRVADGGRLVLAGDHLQLPPIIAGVYPEPPPGEPPLHRSIFEAVVPLRIADCGLRIEDRETPTSSRSSNPQSAVRNPQSRLLRPLLENFRMNDVLTSAAARLLYGAGYRCVGPEVARRRLNYKPGRDADPLVRACLDPQFPLVIVTLDGVRAAQANPVEADLVAQLVTELRQGLRAADGRPYRDDAAFFREGVFVV
ncbi:MAG TPA: AAA domain-containing protein, partial [Gemmataceae bacterium]